MPYYGIANIDEVFSKSAWWQTHIFLLDLLLVWNRFVIRHLLAWHFVYVADMQNSAYTTDLINVINDFKRIKLSLVRTYLKGENYCTTTTTFLNYPLKNNIDAEL